MTKDEALKLALEVLEQLQGGCTDSSDGTYEAITVWCPEVIDAIREALAQPEQEPVAWRWENAGEDKWLNKYIYLDNGGPDCPEDCEPLYTTPPHRKPLTDVTIWNTYKNLWMFHPAEEPRLAGDVLKFARAIEAAHGIKE